MLTSEATPFKQSFDLTPVMTGDDLVNLGKEMLAQAQG
jgi:hypothetical protein